MEHWEFQELPLRLPGQERSGGPELLLRVPLRVVLRPCPARQASSRSLGTDSGRGVGGAAPGRIIRFTSNLDENINDICNQLINGNCHFGDYRYFTIHDPKKREICAPAFRERVIHHAIINITDPIFERAAIYDSYACRKGKGTKKAVERAKYYSKRFPWCLKMDIRKYFDSINHEKLIHQLSRLFKDKRLSDLWNKIIGSYEKTPGRGLPIGNLTSQYFANHYLSEFDRHIKETLRMPGYVRYMDDMLVWGRCKHDLRECLTNVKAYLHETLHLILKENSQISAVNHGVDFLGYRIFPYRIQLSKKSKKRFIQKFVRYEKNYIQGIWSEQELTCHVQALISFTLIADAVGFRRKVIESYGQYPDK